MPVYAGNLQSLIDNHDFSAFPQPPFFTRMAKQMLGALAYLHELKIIHRDLKPLNILFEPRADGDGYNFYLSDFRVAKFQNLSKTAAGTALFMAP